MIKASEISQRKFLKLSCVDEGLAYLHPILRNQSVFLSEQH